jgi:hypothetical protein
MSVAAATISGDAVRVGLYFYDYLGNFLGSLATTEASLAFDILTVKGYAPPYSASVQIFLGLDDVSLGGQAEFDAVTLASCQASAYYISLFSSQYQGSPKFLSFAQALLTPFVDAGICAGSMYQAFDIEFAVGSQLDILGQVLGISRTLPFTPTAGQIFLVTAESATGAGYVVGDTLAVVQGGGSGGQIKVLSVTSGRPTNYQIVAQGTGYATATGLTTTGGTGTGAKVDIVVQTFDPVLTDDVYRILLKAKVAFNQWNGQIDTLYAIWQELFPGGLIDVIDNQNMTATIILAGTFNAIIIDLINHGYIIPRPQAVQYTIAFPVLPVFGFDQNNSFVAGFDSGHWV